MSTMATSFEELFAAAEEQPQYWQQHAMLDFAQEVCRVMEERGISRSQLARRIGKSAAYVTQMLRGDTNFTIATMVRLAMALDCRLRLHLAPAHSVSVWFDDLYRPGEAIQPSDYEPTRAVEVAEEASHEGTSFAFAA